MAQFSAILPNFTGLILCKGRMRLRLLKVLGTGAYGVVYLAHDMNSPAHSPAHYAVKCLLRHPEESEHHSLQQREIAYHTKASSHPHVVKLHDIIEEKYYLYLVLDHCPGGDLFSAIIERGEFANNDARIKRTFLQLLDAVHGCHDLGIFHRDLKPENVLCSHDGDHVFLSDFGLATRTRLSVTFGCGSSFYMSPECVGAHTCKRPFVTSVSDIWSLGVILVNLVTGRNPWHIASPADDQGFASYLNEGERYLTRMLPISRSLGALLARVFATVPEQRINLNGLRKAIIELDTFFPEAKPSEPAPPIAHAVSVDITDFDRSDAISNESEELELVEIRPLPSAITVTLSPPVLRVVNNPSARSTYPSTAVSDGSDRTAFSESLFSEASESSSSSESEGPITPEVHPVEVVTSVPSIALEAIKGLPECDLQLGLTGIVDAAGSASSLGLKKRKMPLSWERFVERIRLRA
ncbi:hypothetical protein IEO21_02081 [Rhodonia placenta]|uniref:non-specific serine/threonine protein kinase n=1 Tax=Rhodonia placenta TaxID=104341 RepID=A0A8H7P886_9APHY|nr:hypothetical protein IEO21_02081 [Postia placenta]